MPFLHNGQGQRLDVQYLNDGQGFIMIKNEELQIINNYRKILYTIDLDSWKENLIIIKNNIANFSFCNHYPTMLHNFNALEEEINNLLPHHTRTKRGLINIIGKGLKFIAGTMDADDELEIRQKLELNEKNNENIIYSLNDQVRINDQFNTAMKKVTNHINKQQKQINYQLSNLIERASKDITIEHMQHIYQIQYDIQLLREQVRKVKENLMLCRLGILGRDILTLQEIKTYNITLKDLMFIKSSAILHDSKIIFIVMIPSFCNQTYHKIIMEPIPNKNKLELDTPYRELILSNDTWYQYTEEIIIMKKHLKIIKDQCIENILKDNPLCNFIINESVEIKQLTNNIVITKNILKTKLTHNCNMYNVTLYGNTVINFENCQININNNIYENININENFILPIFKDVKIKNITLNISLSELHFKNIENRKILEEIKTNNVITNSITFSTIVIIIIALLIMFTFVFLKSKPKMHIINEEIILDKINKSIELLSDEAQDAGRII